MQRLPNGNTFVACRNVLMEFDRAGKEVLNLQRPNEWFLDAQKLRDGQIALLNNQGGYARLDADGQGSEVLPRAVQPPTSASTAARCCPTTT